MYVSGVFTIVVDGVVQGAAVIPHDDIAIPPVVTIKVIWLDRVLVQVM